MASVNLVRTSGDGDVLGTDQLEATRQYIVVLEEDERGQEPVGFVRAEVPFSSSHPEPAWSSLIVVRYRKHAVEGSTLIWLVDVEYGPPGESVGTGRVPSTFFGWNVRISFGSGSETLFRSLPITDARGQLIEQGKIVGPPVYAVVDENNTDTPYTHTAASPTGKPVFLFRDPSIPPHKEFRQRIGMSRLGAGTEIICTRTIHRLSEALLRTFEDFKRHVNDTTMWGFARGALLASGIQIEEIAGASDADTSARVFRAQINISANREGWQDVEMVHTFTNDQGDESPVFPRASAPGAPAVDTNVPVSEFFRRYESAPLGDLFRIASQLSKPQPQARPSGLRQI